MTEAAAPALRIDKWLWFARFFKSRALAAANVAEGTIRLNGNPVSKPSYPLHPGDLLVFYTGPRLRVVRVAALGTRRGPAPEARLLYDDLDSKQPKTPSSRSVHGVDGRQGLC